MLGPYVIHKSLLVELSMLHFFDLESLKRLILYHNEDISGYYLDKIIHRHHRLQI